MTEVIFSIGHSTRPLHQLLALLRVHGIHTLVDIRSIPHSRRNPQYNQQDLQQAIEAEGLGYKHLPALGGHRRAREDSPNTGWINPAFRGYADYMQTAMFERGLCELLELSRVAGPLAMMCAEAVPWRCHRSMVADALVARGISVLHILGPASTRAHRLNPMARIEGAGSVLSRGDHPSRHRQSEKVEQTSVGAELLQKVCLVRGADRRRSSQQT
jgi:uncharacterized protein (DUF488 family)